MALHSSTRRAPPLSPVATRFLKHQETRVSPRTLASQRDALRLWEETLQELDGGGLEDDPPALLEAAAARLCATQGANRLGVLGRTLRQFGRWARRAGVWRRKNWALALTLTPPAVAAVEDARWGRPLSSQERSTLRTRGIDARAKDARLQRAVLELLLADVTLAELLRLRWSHVELETATLRIPQGRKQGMRRQPLDRPLQDALRGWGEASARAHWVCFEGTAPSRTLLEQRAQRLASKAGLPHLGLSEAGLWVARVAGAPPPEGTPAATRPLTPPPPPTHVDPARRAPDDPAERLEALVNVLATQHAMRRRTLSAELGWSHAAVKSTLAEGRRLGLVRMVGRAGGARWQVA